MTDNMRQLIRYFTLRRRVKKMLVECVKFEYKWHKEYDKLYEDKHNKHLIREQLEMCKQKIEEQVFLFQKLMELL